MSRCTKAGLQECSQGRREHQTQEDLREGRRQAVHARAAEGSSPSPAQNTEAKLPAHLLRTEERGGAGLRAGRGGRRRGRRRRRRRRVWRKLWLWTEIARNCSFSIFCMYVTDNINNKYTCKFTFTAIIRHLFDRKIKTLIIVLCHSDKCTEELISLGSLEAWIAQRYISAVRYTNLNGIVVYKRI